MSNRPHQDRPHADPGHRPPDAARSGPRSPATPPAAESLSAVLAALADDPAPPPFALLRREGGDVELLLGGPEDVF
ncbi:MAG TPA: hypothetical protein VFP72_15215, partial [Kineosporiaceae bacterium]|nr:hypothetical protein [Kineosporiaceae bacterium]